MKTFYISSGVIHEGIPVQFWEYDWFINMGVSEKVLLSRKNSPDVVKNKIYYASSC